MALRLLVLGNGVAGATAARVARVRAPDAEVTLVSDEHPLPYARTALMYVFMGHLRAPDTHLYDAAFWDRNRIARRTGRATRLDPAARTLHLDDGAALPYDRLLVATGSRPRRLGVPGEDLTGVVRLQGLADLGRIEAALAATPGPAVVVGGGLTGVELTEMLRARHRAVTFLVREGRLMPRALSPDESRLAEAEVRRHGVDLRTGEAVTALDGRGAGDGAGAVRAVRLASGGAVAAGVVGITVGVEPNTALAAAAGLAVGRGVRVDACLRTSAPDVFAAGDCAELPPHPPAGTLDADPVAPGRVEQLWYTARAQGAAAGEGLAGHPTPYAPGVPFNSAKFYRREWQSYGHAPGTLPDGLDALGWADDRAGQAFRLVVGDGRVVGVSAFGLRLRAQACTGWVARGVAPGAALNALGTALFDPEFTPRRTRALAAALAPPSASAA